MGERRAVGRPREIAQAAPRLGERNLAELHPVGDLGKRAEDEPKAKADAEGRKPRTTPPGQSEQQDNGRKRDDHSHHEALRRRNQVPALPREQRPERHGNEKRSQERHEGEIEEGRANGDLFPGDRFEREWVKRNDEDGGARRCKQKRVEHERTFAAYRREQAALRQKRRAPGEERERTADEETHDGKTEDD